MGFVEVCPGGTPGQAVACGESSAPSAGFATIPAGTGVYRFVHPDAAIDAVTNGCRWYLPDARLLVESGQANFSIELDRSGPASAPH